MSASRISHFSAIQRPDGFGNLCRVQILTLNDTDES